MKPILTITSYLTIKVLYSYNVLEKHSIRMSFPINAQFWLDDFGIYMSTKLVLESFMTRWLIDDIFCSFELWWVKASACTRQWEWLILSYRINSLQIDVYIYWHSLDWSCRLSYPRNPYVGLFIMVWHQYKSQRTQSFWFFICLLYFKSLDFFSCISALLLLSMFGHENEFTKRFLNNSKIFYLI